MEITIRPAEKYEAKKLAEFSIMAGGGTFELLLKGVRRGVSVLEIMTALCAGEETEYSYQYFVVAESNGKVLGAVNVLKVEERQRLSPRFAEFLREQIGFNGWNFFLYNRRARHLDGMRTIRSPHSSFHINEISVLPETRGTGIGRKLVEHCVQRAGELGLEYVSLYVWSDNISAVKFYKKLGFVEEAVAKVRPHKFLQHSESTLMLRKL